MTKFYLHNANSTVSGTLPSTEQSSLTADSNFFTGVTDADNKSMDTTIGTSQANLTNTSTGDTSSHNYYIMKWVSPLLYQSNITAQTWTLEYGAKEANAQANFPVSGTAVAGRINCYVWKPSNGTKVGTVLDGNTNADCEEAGTAQSVINTTFSGAAVTGITAGDAVLVIELWAVVTQASSTTRVQDIYYDGTTEASTSNIAAYLSTPENLELTQTALSATTILSGASQASTANTTEYWALVGKLNPFTTEANAQLIVKKAGTISKLSINIPTNSTTGITFTVRKNAADTSLAVTFGSGVTGIQEDLTDSFTVAAGDKICIKSVPSATGTVNTSVISVLFTPTDDIPTHILGSSGMENFATASVEYYIPIGGRAFFTQTENNAKARQKKAGTYKNFYFYVASNARTTTTTIRSRKNGANGNIVVTIGAGATGVFEDTANQDVVAVDDDYNFSITSGTGTETLNYTMVEINFFPNDYSGLAVSCYTGTSTIGAGLTRYAIVGGQPTAFTSEVSAKRKWRGTKASFTNLGVYCKTNTLTADSTLTFMINGVAGNLTLTVTSGTTGWFFDTTHRDFVQAGDDIDIKIVAGGTGTSIDLNLYIIYYETGVTLPRIYKYNMLQRPSNSIVFDGVDDRIDCGNHSTLWSQGLTKFSFSIWIRPTAGWDGQFRGVVVHGTGAQSFECYINSVNTGNIRFFIRDSVNTLREAQSQDLVLNKWNNVIGTYDNSLGSANCKLFVNNVLGSNTFPLTETINQSATLYISNNANDLKGNAKDFRWWSTIALDSTQRANVMNNSSSAPTPDYWILMEEVTGSPIDSIGGKTTTLENGAAKDNTTATPYGGNPKTYKYHILQRISLARTYLWNVLVSLTRISLDRTYKYHVVGRVSLSRIYKYHILGRVSLSRIYKYNLLGRISLSRVYKYHVLARLSLSRIYKYNLLGRVSLSRIYKYHVLQRISLARIYKYHVAVRVSLSRIYKYHILSRVSLSRIYKYHVLARISLSRIYKYHILGRISLSRVYKYHVLSRVSLSRIYKYNLLGRISLSRIYKYHVAVRVSLARVYKYHVVARVSLARIYLWNVAVAGLTRITLAQTYKYHVIGRISLTRIYKYNVAVRVSLARIYKYHVLARVSLSRIYKYHLLSRVSLSRIYKYHVFVRVSLSRVYKYHLLGRISLSRIYKYHLLARVSLSNIYKYHILQRLSLSRIYKYNILQKVSLSRIYKFSITGRLSKILILKYNVATTAVTQVAKIIEWVRREYAGSDPVY